MEYILENIKFDENFEYNAKDYWLLYRIYDAYKIGLECKMIYDLEYASCVVGEIGVLCFHKKIDKDLENSKELLYKKGILLYKMFAGFNFEYTKDNYDFILNATSLDELKKFPKITNEDIKYADTAIEKYIERIKKFIPRNILEKIADLKLFALGFIEESIYEELLVFKNKLEKWLLNPNGTNKKYLLDDELDLEEFHDMLYDVSLNDNNLILKSNDLYTPIDIKFNNCKILFLDDKGEFEEIKEHPIMLEGYTYTILKRSDGFYEGVLEFVECTIIIEFQN